MEKNLKVDAEEEALNARAKEIENKNRDLSLHVELEKRRRDQGAGAGARAPEDNAGESAAVRNERLRVKRQDIDTIYAKERDALYRRASTLALSERAFLLGLDERPLYYHETWRNDPYYRRRFRTDLLFFRTDNPGLLVYHADTNTYRVFELDPEDPVEVDPEHPEYEEWRKYIGTVRPDQVHSKRQWLSANTDIDSGVDRRPQHLEDTDTAVAVFADEDDESDEDETRRRAAAAEFLFNLRFSRT
jgi:hypothetical protein